MKKSSLLLMYCKLSYFKRVTYLKLCKEYTNILMERNWNNNYL